MKQMLILFLFLAQCRTAMDGTLTGRGSGPMVKALTGDQALGYEEKERHDDQVRNIQNGWDRC